MNPEQNVKPEPMPCPFCGQDGYEIQPHEVNGEEDGRLWCMTCGCVGPASFVSERTEIWNRRSPVSSDNGNECREALEWLGKKEYDLVKQLRSDDWGVVIMEGYVVKGVGKTPLLAIQAAMKQDGGGK